jgi:hypothetical protein
LGGIHPKSDITVSDLVEVADFVDFLNGEARYMLFDKFSTKEDFFHDYVKMNFLNERTRDYFSRGKELLPNDFKIDGARDLQGCELLEPDNLISDFADWINNVRDIYISEDAMLQMADLALNDLYKAITSEMIDFFGVEGRLMNMKKWNIVSASNYCCRNNHQNRIQSTTKGGNTYACCEKCRSWIGIGN